MKKADSSSEESSDEEEKPAVKAEPAKKAVAKVAEAKKEESSSDEDSSDEEKEKGNICMCQGLYLHSHGCQNSCSNMKTWNFEILLKIPGIPMKTGCPLSPQNL